MSIDKQMAVHHGVRQLEGSRQRSGAKDPSLDRRCPLNGFTSAHRSCTQRNKAREVSSAVRAIIGTTIAQLAMYGLDSSMGSARFITICFCLALLGAAPAAAYPRFQQQVPSIPVVGGSTWPGVGHTSRQGGGARNAFGQDFEAAGYKWTPELCQKDSDGDGFTNGQELGDPTCTWSAGKPQVTAVSHPGLADSVPAASGRK